MGNTYVTYRAFITIIISMIVAGASLFGYILHLHAGQNQEGREALSKRVDGVELRSAERLKSIDTKLDKIFDKLISK